jgi:hypothetical protein
MLPETDRPTFLSDALDRYRAAVCDQPGEEHLFKTFQMQVIAARA